MDHLDKEHGAPDASSDSSSQGHTDYPVGYAKPPMIRRFKSGEPGNRRGRPRGSKNRKTIVREIANEVHTVTEDGRRRRRSTLELMLLALRNLAVSGTVRAFRAYEKYLAKFEPQTRSKLGYMIAPPEMTEEEVRAEAERMNEEGRAQDLAEAMKKSRQSAGPSPDSGGPGGPAGARRLGPP